MKPNLPISSPADSWLLFLASLVLILASVLGFSLQQEAKEPKTETVVTNSPSIVDKGIEPPALSAQAAYAVDVESGKVLFSKNIKEPLLPASTTKIMTALVSLSHYNLDDTLTVDIGGVEGHKMGLKNGEKMAVRDLLYGLLVSSGNDAAEVLAANYPGGRENFVSAMNRLADDIGLEDSNFRNPVGFDEYLHFSTAKDLVKAAIYAIKNPVFSEIVSTRETKVMSVDGKIVHKLDNINELLGKVPGVIGVKTGWTVNAGEALVTLIERGGHKVMLSVLSSDDRFGETEKLINWIYSNYEWTTLSTPTP